MIHRIGHRHTRTLARTATMPFVLLAACITPSVHAEFELGVQTHYGQFWERYELSLPMIQQANLNWVRAEMYWSAVERKKGELILPDYYTEYADQLAQAGVEPLIILNYNHGDYDKGRFPDSGEALEGFVRYCEFIVRSRPNLKMVEIWNEIHLDLDHWGRSATAEGVAHLLRTLCPRLKAIRPDLIIIGPNLEGGEPDEDLKKLFQHDVLSLVDGVSVHPYGNPDSLVGRMERLQAMLRTFNDGKDKPIYFSEFGWSTCHETAVSEHQQARNVARSLLWARSMPYVKGAWLYNMVDCATTGGKTWRPELVEDNFGFLKNDGTPKLAYAVLRDLATVIRQGRFLSRTEKTSPNPNPQQVRLFEFEMPDTQRACAAWQTDAEWASFSTFKVTEPNHNTVELLKLGTGIPVRRTLSPEGTFSLYLDGDDVPWLIRGQWKSIEIQNTRWVRTQNTPAAVVPHADARRFAQPPKIDGLLDEWSDKTFVAFDEKPVWSRRQEPWQGTEDLSARFALAWDAHALYVAVEVIDDTHQQAFTYTNIWQGDCVQAAWHVCTDPADDYVLFGTALTPEGIKNVSWDLPMRFRADPENALKPITSAIVRHADRTTYEFAIPLSSGLLGQPQSLAKTWTENATLQFAIGVNDNDGVHFKRRKQALGWSKGIITVLDPARFGIVTLKP